MNTQNYAVNIRVGLANPARVNISQGDTGRTLAFSLYDGLSPFTPPTGSTVTIVGRKPSKLGFSEACTVSGNVATVTTTLAMTQEAGKFPVELRIEANGESIGTANFTMYIEPSPHPDGTTDGTHATVDNLQTQIGNLANLATTAKTNLVSAINEAAQSGGVVIDDTLTQTGAAADSKKTGDEIASLKADLNNQYINEFYEVVKSPNMIDGEESLTTGYMAKTGSTDHTTTSMCYTEFIPVSEGDIVRAYQINQGAFSSRNIRMMCCFDANKTVMSAVGSNDQMATFTVPAGVAYIRPTLYDADSITAHMLTLNYEATKFEPYGEQNIITQNFLTSDSQNAVDALVNNAYTRKLVANRYACGVPKQGLKMTIELQQPWYIESLVSQSFLSIQLGAAGEVKRYEDRVEFICATPKDGGSGYKFYVYDEVFGSTLYSVNKYVPSGYGLPVKWANLNLSDCSLLVIGDSTVDQDTMTAKILEEFTAQGHTVTLLGTLGSGLNKNEGRAGWKATDYLTNKSYEGTVNPFYNPTSQTFDFGYYMTNQGYTSPDFVVIQLGINDLYNLTYDAVPTAIETTWNAIKTMIDSIIAYNANIKIILNLPTTPKNDISVHTSFLPLYRNTRMMYNDYAQEQARAYSINNVRVSYCHLVLKEDTDIRDTVHPNTDGYTKMAKEIVSQINVWQN